jgi:hypothetical protein
MTSKEVWKERFRLIVCVENRVKDDLYMSGLNMDSYVTRQHLEPIMDIIAKHLTNQEMKEIRKEVDRAWNPVED